MANYRFTLVGNYKGRGMTETFWTESVAASVAANLINKWMTKRVAFLPSEVTIEGIRVAEEGGQRHSQFLIPGSSYWPDAGKLIPVPEEGGFGQVLGVPRWAQWRAILQFRVSYGNNQKAIRYVSGVPAEVEGTEPGGLIPKGNSSWWDKFYAWLQLLENGNYYIKALQKPADPLLWRPTGIFPPIAPATDLALGFNSATFPGVTVGQRVHVYNFRPAKGTRNPTLNGTWYVSKVDTTSISGTTLVSLRNSKGIDPALQRFTDKTYMFPVTHVISKINLTQALRVGIRKRGKVSTLPRGRVLTRATLDP